MNPNEKRVFRVGLVLCVLSFLVAAPLVWAATRPVVPPPQAVEPAVPSVEAPPAAPEAVRVVTVPTVVLVSRAAPKARPAQAKAHRAVDCENAQHREREELKMGTVGSSVVYCHD